MNTSAKTVTFSNNNITGSTLKIIAMITMLIDHFGVAIVEYLPGMQVSNSLTHTSYLVCRMIGRIAFVIYLFLLLEGVKYTHNKLVYAMRMLIFAIISEVPFDLCFYNKFVYWQYNNVMFTLFIGILMLSAFMYIKEYAYVEVRKYAINIIKVVYFLLPSVYFAYFLYCRLIKYVTLTIDARIIVIIFAVLCESFLIGIYVYLLKKKTSGDLLLFICDTLILAVFLGLADLCHSDYSSSGILALAVMFFSQELCADNDPNKNGNSILFGTTALAICSNPSELFALVIYPVISKYNGKKGFTKSFIFYFFYPVHILLLYFIRKLLF